MKKAFVFCLCFVMCLMFVGCGYEKEAFVFDDLEFEVKMRLDEQARAAKENTTMLISNVETGSSLGVISVAKMENKNIHEIYETYIIGGGDKTKTEISDKLIFVDIMHGVDSEVPEMHCFIFYDEATGAVLYGRFFQNCERDYVIHLAKSIEVSKM